MYMYVYTFTHKHTHTHTHTRTHIPPIPTYRPSSISGNLEALETMPLEHLSLYNCKKVQGTKELGDVWAIGLGVCEHESLPPSPPPPLKCWGPVTSRG